MPVVTSTELESLVRDLLVAAGMSLPRAAAMADVMVQTDLMGHRTHGVAFLPTYLDRIAVGQIKTDGEVEVLSEGPTDLAWSALHLPGAWVMRQAMDALYERLKIYPVVTATIGGCSHVGSLQTYLKEIGEKKYMGQMMVADPGVSSVAPFGGADAVITTNPMAAAIPTRGNPILIDQSTALVSNAFVQARGARGELLPGAWLLDGEGRPSRDPAVLKADPPGTILPLGGVEFGYKGFGFGLMVEAWGPSLSGHGRSTPKTRGGQGVFLQIIDPAAFVGSEAFLDETTDLVRRCYASRPAEGSSVRLPGERAYAEAARQRREGITIAPDLAVKLAEYCSKAGITAPGALAPA